MNEPRLRQTLRDGDFYVLINSIKEYLSTIGIVVGDANISEVGGAAVLTLIGGDKAIPAAILDDEGNHVTTFGSPSTNAEKFGIADYTSTSTATLRASYTITESAQIVALTILRTNTATVLSQGSGGYAFKIAGQVITVYKDGVADTSAFGVGDVVAVTYNDYPYSYSSARDANKVDVINQEADRTTPYPNPLTTVTAGGYGATITTTVANGAVTVATIDAGGTNYAVGNILRLEGGDYNCWVKVATLTGSAIATLTIVQPGTGYTNGETYSAYLYTPVVSDISGLPTGAIKHLSFGGYMLDADATIKFIILGSNNTDTNDWSGTTTPFKRWHNIRFYDECADTFTNHIDSTNAYKVINAEIENLNREYFQFGLLTNSAGFEYAIFARTKVI